MRRPRITQTIIDGIIHATSFMLAGDTSDESEKDLKAVERADQWAREMRDWMRQRGTWKEHQ